MSDNIYLIGFMGTGKSTVAGQLAKISGRRRIEMDQAIEGNQSMPIPRIFELYGEDYFRNLESALVEKLSRENGQIVSCGGGCILRSANVSLMKSSGRIVLLTASPQTIFERVRHSSNRPILNGHMDPAYIAELMAKRQPAYEAAADLVIETDGKKPEAIAREILGHSL